MSISPSNLRSQVALRFFGLSTAILFAAAIVAVAGIQLLNAIGSQSQTVMPIPFWISTVLLALGSLTLHQAAWHVRVQQLDPFRQRLVWSLVIGTLFVGVQSAGLWQMSINQTLPGTAQPQSAETGANAFVAMFAGMHGVHFVVALMFVTWITVNAFSQRYDHEYSWGVTFCAWFWHTLGLAWLAILALFAAGAVTGFEAISLPDPQSIP